MAAVDDASAPTDGAVVALIGSFNPPIFHPQWFVHHGLLDEPEAAEAAEVQVNEFVSLFESRRFAFEATRRQLTISSTPASESYLPLADLAASIFRLLSHTPITAIGMLRFKHVQLRGTSWPGVSSNLVDLDRWSAILPSPRLDRLEVETEWPDVAGEPTVRAVVEPSRLHEGALYLALSADFESLTDSVDEGDAGQGAERAVELLHGGWSTVLTRSDELVEMVSSWL